MIVKKIMADAWQGYKANLSVLIYSYTIVLIVILVSISFSVMMINIIPSLLYLWLGIGLTGMLIASVLEGGFIALCNDALKGRTSMRKMFYFSMNYWKALLFSSILKTIIHVLLFLPVIILLLHAINTDSIIFLLFSIMLGIITVFPLLLFSLPLFSVVLERTTPLLSIKRSIEVVKSRYIDFIFLHMKIIPTVIILLIAIFIISSITHAILNFIFLFIFVLFFMPFLTLSYAAFFMFNVSTTKKRKG